MKAITKTVIITVVSSCLFFFSATQAASAASNKGKKRGAVLHDKKNKSVKLLSVFQSRNATLKYIKGNEYEFSFPINKDSKVLVFSDRPHRVAFTLPRNEWARMVMSGPNSFKVDQPNAVITWADLKVAPAAYTIVSYKHRKSSMVYTLKAIGDHTNTLRILHDKLKEGQVDVFVDSSDYCPVDYELDYCANNDVSSLHCFICSW